MIDDPTLPQIIITIDPDSGDYEVVFDELKNDIIIDVLTSILISAKNKTLPRKKDV